MTVIRDANTNLSALNSHHRLRNDDIGNYEVYMTKIKKHGKPKTSYPNFENSVAIKSVNLGQNNHTFTVCFTDQCVKEH